MAEMQMVLPSTFSKLADMFEHTAQIQIRVDYDLSLRCLLKHDCQLLECLR